MRRVIGMLKETRKNMLVSPSPEKLAEIDDMFGVLDRNLSGFAEYGNEELSEVMTSADFTYAITEFVQRRMLPGYQEQVFAFEPLVYNDVVPNYLLVNRYQNRQGVDDLEYVGEKGPPRPGSVTDAVKRQWQVFRWEKQFDFSHEALVNDDLGYFDDMAVMMGRSACRTLEKYVSRLYTNATSIAVFTGLGALYSTTGRLTTARISTARMAFGQRTNAGGERILTPLNFIVYHSGLKDVVATIQASELVPELATNASNVVRGTFTAIEDPYIAGTAPNLPWYAFCTPSQIKTLVLVRMAGRPGPMILRRKSDTESVTSLLGAGAAVNPILGDFDSGNIVLKVSDVFGTYIDGTEGNIVDSHGGYYSAGTAV